MQTPDLYDACVRDLVLSFCEGYNAAIFAYGPTCSGKTFTMLGNDQGNDGVVQLAVQDIFRHILEHNERKFMMTVAYLEVYNEQVWDLCDGRGYQVSLCEDQSGDVKLEGLSWKVVSRGPEDIYACLRDGSERRHIADNKINERSSRSHTILRIRLESSDLSAQDAVFSSVLDLVDLAGSEGLRHTDASGLRRREAKNINQSLLQLGQVIRDLSDRSRVNNFQHIPFRGSKLTRILQSSIGGNSQTVIICAVSPVTSNRTEARSTLDFASSAMSVRKKVQANVVAHGQSTLIREYTAKINDLKAQLKDNQDHLRRDVGISALREQNGRLEMENQKLEKKIIVLQRTGFLSSRRLQELGFKVSGHCSDTTGLASLGQKRRHTMSGAIDRRQGNSEQLCVRERYPEAAQEGSNGYGSVAQCAVEDRHRQLVTELEDVRLARERTKMHEDAVERELAEQRADTFERQRQLQSRHVVASSATPQKRRSMPAAFTFGNVQPLPLQDIEPGRQKTHRLSAPITSKNSVRIHEACALHGAESYSPRVASPAPQGRAESTGMRPLPSGRTQSQELDFLAQVVHRLREYVGQPQVRPADDCNIRDLLLETSALAAAWAERCSVPQVNCSSNVAGRSEFESRLAEQRHRCGFAATQTLEALEAFEVPKPCQTPQAEALPACHASAQSSTVSDRFPASDVSSIGGHSLVPRACAPAGGTGDSHSASKQSKTEREIDKVLLEWSSGRRGGHETTTDQSDLLSEQDPNRSTRRRLSGSFERAASLTSAQVALPQQVQSAVDPDARGAAKLAREEARLKQLREDCAAAEERRANLEAEVAARGRKAEELQQQLHEARITEANCQDHRGLDSDSNSAIGQQRRTLEATLAKRATERTAVRTELERVQQELETSKPKVVSAEERDRDVEMADKAEADAKMWQTRARELEAELGAARQQERMSACIDGISTPRDAPAVVTGPEKEAPSTATEAKQSPAPIPAPVVQESAVARLAKRPTGRIVPRPKLPSGEGQACQQQ
jgi:centromeric protein E